MFSTSIIAVLSSFVFLFNLVFFNPIAIISSFICSLVSILFYLVLLTYVSYSSIIHRPVAISKLFFLINFLTASHLFIFYLHKYHKLNIPSSYLPDIVRA